MNVGPYLKEKQPIAYETFSRALSEKKLAHAYLLVGERGIPLKEIGEYFAKSILCDNPSPLADETCETCSRISRLDYPDYRFYDGSDTSIKKDEVQSLIRYFEQTPLEEKGIMVYLIHCVEGMTVEAENSLLKFLEEPNPCAYAILTTKNESKVLPTIISRCQEIRLLVSSREEVLNACKTAGIEEKDAELLSFFLNDAELIKEESQSKTYINAKMAFEAIIEALSESNKHARFVAENEAIGYLKERPSLRYFFEFMTVFYQDVVASRYLSPLKMPSYAKISQAIAQSCSDPSQALLSLMKMRQEIDTNINGGLLVLHMLHTLNKE